MLNEAALFRKYKTQETKKKNRETIERITYNVIKLLNEGIDSKESIAEGILLLLDRRMPKEGSTTRDLFDDIVNDKAASAITITYNQALRDRYTELELRKYTVSTLHTICFNYDIPMELLLIPDTDYNGNYHYHGLIKSPLKYRPILKRLITRFIGFMKFDYISDCQGWTEYCYKTAPKYQTVYNEAEILKLFIFFVFNTKEKC